MSIDLIRKESHQILNSWIASCTRGGKVSRHTVAIGIVVFDHLRKACPVTKDDAISQGGEVKGARSGLGNTLEAYGIPVSYLKEVTTRQGHQDGQRLFEQFDWGNHLLALTDDDRDSLLLDLIGALRTRASEWLQQ